LAIKKDKTDKTRHKNQIIGIFEFAPYFLQNNWWESGKIGIANFA
jgi:hypothetical protein